MHTATAPALKPSFRGRQTAWRRLSLIAMCGTAIILLLMAARAVPLAPLIIRSSLFVEGHGFLAIFMYGVIYVAATLLCLPVLPLTIGAGLLFGVFSGALVVTFATTTAAVIAFLIGRYTARARLRRFAARFAKFDAIDRAVKKEGWRIIFLFRFVVFIPFGLSNYLYGLTAISIIPYTVATCMAMLPGTIFYAYLGSIGRQGLMTGTLTGSDYVIIAVALVMKVSVISYVIRRVKRVMGQSPSGKPRRITPGHHRAPAGAGRR